MINKEKSRKITVWLVSSSSIPIPPPKGGAIEKILYEIYIYLKRNQKVNPIILTPKGGIKHNSIKILKLPYRFFIVADILNSFIIGILALIKKPDIIHYNTPLISIFPMIISKLFGIKSVYTSHNPNWTVAEKCTKAQKLFLKIELLCMKLADKVIAISDTMKKYFIRERVNPKKIIKIYNPVDVEKFQKSKKNNREIRKILYVGKLTPVKGVDHLLYIARELQKLDQKIIFIIIGGRYYGDPSNPYLEKAHRLGLKNVIFKGVVPEEKLAKIYQSADAFILLSEKEGCPMVALEAMASGLPIIYNNIDVLKEVIDGAGIPVDRKKHKKTAQKIFDLMNNKTNIKKFSIISRNRAEKIFNKKYILPRYEKLYLSLT